MGRPLEGFVVLALEQAVAAPYSRRPRLLTTAAIRAEFMRKPGHFKGIG
jgi:hypothetical protein